jgi:hypothetical protein
LIFLLILFLTVSVFAFAHLALYKIDPNQYEVKGVANIIAFFDLALRGLYMNQSLFITPISTISALLCLLEGGFAMIVLGLLFTLFLSIKKPKEVIEMEEAIEEIREQGRIMEASLVANYRITVEEAIIILTKLKASLLTFILWVSRQIDPRSGNE